MTLMDCVGSRAHYSLLQAVDECVRDCDTSRLRSILASGTVSVKQLNHRSVLHRAVWLGHTACVRLLVEHGVQPDEPHRKNGCTPLHLAHFCTIDDTNPNRTIRTLVEAGANINNPGSSKCGKFPIDHAIQHQRLDSVKALLDHGSLVTLQTLQIAIDVANPCILELLLMNGADCGSPVETTPYWGQPLHRALYMPLKCPRECYNQMFRILVQATVCAPLFREPQRLRCPSTPNGDLAETSPNLNGCGETSCLPTLPCVSYRNVPHFSSSSVSALIDVELRAIARDHFDVALYLYACLLRNGLRPTESCRRYMRGRASTLDWVDIYLRNPAPLQDLAIRILRSLLHSSCNILHATHQLKIPLKLRNLILLVNPY